MKTTTDELQGIVSDFAEKIAAIPDAEFYAKPLPDKWSRIEVVGHLIDSAQNNLRRFITGQYETQPPFIAYQQDFWVSSNEYQKMNKEEIIMLWRLINMRICAVLNSMPAENYQKQCDTGSLHSLSWLAADYVKHLKHHLNQIISGSFDVVYK